FARMLSPTLKSPMKLHLIFSTSAAICHLKKLTMIQLVCLGSTVIGSACALTVAISFMVASGTSDRTLRTPRQFPRLLSAAPRAGPRRTGHPRRTRPLPWQARKLRWPLVFPPIISNRCCEGEPDRTCRALHPTSSWPEAEAVAVDALEQV